MLSRFPWTALKTGGGKSNEMSHAQANTALSWPKSNFKAMEAVPAPAHNSSADNPGGKLTKDPTVSCHTESFVHGGRMPGNSVSSTMVAGSWMWVAFAALWPRCPRMDVQAMVEVKKDRLRRKPNTDPLVGTDCLWLTLDSLLATTDH